MQEPVSILITGASSGLGAALVREYARPGVTLFLGGRDRDRLKSVAEEAEAKGGAVYRQAVDVTDRDAMSAWIAGADSLLPLDLVIANAGISGGTADGLELAEQARAIFAVNLDGVLNCVLPAVEAMQARGRGGQIAVMASLAGYFGMPGAPAYSASKAAVLQYALALRGALRPDGIAVNAICPGFVRTPMTDVNSFPMPLLMDTDRAARIMVTGLARNRAVIAFPWPMRALVGLLAAIPASWRGALLSHLPAKG